VDMLRVFSVIPSFIFTIVHDVNARDNKAVAAIPLVMAVFEKRIFDRMIFFCAMDI